MRIYLVQEKGDSSSRLVDLIRLLKLRLSGDKIYLASEGTHTWELIASERIRSANYDTLSKSSTINISDTATKD